MPHLFGKDYAAEELRQLTGMIGQVAGVRLAERSDGRARGMRVAEIRTGSGLEAEVLLDRALDLGAVAFAGRPLAWLNPALGGPELYEPQGAGWVRTFGGGLMTTCGLTHFGQPEQDGAEALGLHGRISHTRADHVAVVEAWRGDDYVLQISGQARQATLFGENLLLTRTITTHLGSSTLTVDDTVRNDGWRETPHMILYHCNLGFPVVSPDSELLVHDELVKPRDAAAAAGLVTHTRFDPPAAEYPEQVFFHQPRVGADGFVQAAIVNRPLAFGAYVRYRAAELPFLAQWKMMGRGDYVCALEPANQWETPRAQLRREGRLKMLTPGEEVHYHLEFGVLADATAIQAFEAHQEQTAGA
jgi:hypothetical protein